MHKQDYALDSLQRLTMINSCSFNYKLDYISTKILNILFSSWNDTGHMTIYSFKAFNNNIINALQ